MNRAVGIALGAGLLLSCMITSAPSSAVSSVPSPVLPSAAAQKQSASRKAASASPNQLIAVKVTGTERYTDKEILAASGLKMGQSAGDGDFNEAVKRLGDSGLFTNVAYTYSASSAGTKLEIQVGDVEASKLVPAHFENFIWFTDEELNSALQKSVPLFKGLLPVIGNLPGRVAEALQVLFNEKQLPGRIDFTREAAEKHDALQALSSDEGEITAISYRVEEVSIRIRSVEFPGASPEQAAILESAAHRLTGAEYSRSTLAATAKFDLLPVYFQRGYLKARFYPSDGRVLKAESSAAEASSPGEVEVDAVLRVDPGKVYLTSAVDWKGNSAIKSNEIAPLLELPVGQPADDVRLVREVESVNKLYRRRGYMAVQIKVDRQFDDDKSSVLYELSISEGERYKMGEVEILGLDTQAQARMLGAWTLHEGQPYNADYPNKFLEDTRDIVPRGVQWNVTVHETPDASDKTVDVEIRFKQP